MSLIQQDILKLGGRVAGFIKRREFTWTSHTLQYVRVDDFVPPSLCTKADEAWSTVMIIFIEAVFWVTMVYEAHIDF